MSYPLDLFFLKIRNTSIQVHFSTFKIGLLVSLRQIGLIYSKSTKFFYIHTMTLCGKFPTKLFFAFLHWNIVIMFCVNGGITLPIGRRTEIDRR